MSKTLFIENSPFLTRLVITDELKESIQVKQGKNNTLIVKNIPGTILNRTNQNGRIYSTAEIQKAIDAARPQIETKQLLCSCDEHPEGSFVSPSHAAFVIIGAYIKKNVKLEVEGEKGTFDVLFCDIEVLNTSEGKNLQALLLSGCSLGTSIRGLGDMDGDQVVNYEFLGFDIVSNPSSGTFTNMPIYEAKIESIEENALNEATKFTVSTYASNTTHDLQQAMDFQDKASTSLQYGTITNMNTKMDQEVDPKTGVEKTVGEVEVETSDDVSDLKTALEIAGRAFTNPENINVTSITIEKVDEDDIKDSVMQGGASDTLKEEPVEEDALKEEELAQGMWIKTELLDPAAVYYVDAIDEESVTLIKNSDHGPKVKIELDGSFVFPWSEVKDEVDNVDVSEPLPEATQLKENEKWVLAIDCADGVAYVQDLRDNTEYANDWDITEDENMAVVFDSEEAANEFKNQFIMQGENEEKLPTLNMFYAKKLENIEEATTDGTIEQNDETLTIDVDGNEVEKEFRTPEEARVAKAGLENGELTADVMYNEAGSWWGLKVSAGDYADWYVTDEGNGVDVTADENMALVFPTEEEAKRFQQENGCEEYEYQNGLRASVTPVQMGITDEEIFGKQEESNMDEKLYGQEDPASDEFQQQPVTEEIKDLKVTLGDIVYDVDDEPDFEGDPSEIENILNQLPETIEVELNGVDVPENDAEQFIYQKACEQTGLPIKNATIIDIEEIEKEEVKEDGEEGMDMDATTDMSSNDMGGLEGDSGMADEADIGGGDDMSDFGGDEA